MLLLHLNVAFFVVFVSPFKDHWFREHEWHRGRICAVCLCQGGHRADQPVLERSRTEELIRQYVDSQYVSSDPRSPGGTCQDCRCRLADWAGGKKANPRPLFIAAGVDLGVVAEGGKCQCYFCTVSALNGATLGIFFEI